MADPRIIDIQLDQRTILWRNADVEQERRIAIFDLLEDNHFAPQRVHADGYAGPYKVMLRVEDGRLGIEINREDDTPLEAIILSLGRFRRPIREYFAICDSYYQAISNASPQQIETVDMARRGIHNDAAEVLKERLEGKIEVDFDTARRLFTLICVLHIKGKTIRVVTLGGLLVRIGAGLAVVAALALALWLYARAWAPDRDQYPVQGVSISADNGSVDWGTLAAQGADFAYIRAGDAADHRDPAFAANWRGARTAGLRYGALIEFTPCRLASDQATRFMTTVPRDNAALPPVIRLAFTPSCTARPNRDLLLSELNTLVNLVEGHAGKTVLLNVSEDFDKAYDIGSGINRTLWLDGNFFPPDYATKPWVMWTASDMRHIDGVDGPVRWNVVTP